MAKAYLVGSGIAALSAAAFLIRDGGFAGRDIHLLEEQEVIGGSLDAGGTAETGYSMRGGRMFEGQFRCTYDLLSSIPSADDPSKSVTEDTFAAHDAFPWDDAGRLVDSDGKIEQPGSWQLWQWLARGRDDFGNPHVFDRSVKDSTWESFTVTCKDPLFVELMEALSGREAGEGGLMTFPSSNWLLTIVLNRQPVYREQPHGVTVWWGYGLFPDRPGDYVGKPMTDCTGQEILREVLYHLKFEANLDRIAEASTVIPCLMPYITSQFLVREHGDRPQVVPKGATNLAFIGQFAEVPDDVVFTVEYAVRTAWTAVDTLLKLGNEPPPVYKGQRDPRVLMNALTTMHQR
ncbi:oleate hydratase [Streptomyces fildesensis]|uniref:oleate hydratase n=1 Tax=Streptomyces fildesensis TaxID=375757 RepID=UPI0018E02B48|nr:oleate hydratase [Streptomyces fildesensis]